MRMLVLERKQCKATAAALKDDADSVLSIITIIVIRIIIINDEDDDDDLSSVLAIRWPASRSCDPSICQDRDPAALLTPPRYFDRVGGGGWQLGRF